VSEGLVSYLEEHQGSATYLVAVDGSQSAAPFILQTGKAVIAMGGFTGSDPAPTLSQFKHLVATGKVHYVYISGNGGGGAPSVAGTSASHLAGRTGAGFPAGGPPGIGGRPAGADLPGGAGLGAPGEAGDAPGAGGHGSDTTSAVDSWVEKHGTVVKASSYGGSSGGGKLYYVSSSAAAS
jgi:4-amino-4-deoxy-L-arabinose transferase-like glycosyltransferase